MHAEFWLGADSKQVRLAWCRCRNWSLSLVDRWHLWSLTGTCKLRSSVVRPRPAAPLRPLPHHFTCSRILGDVDLPKRALGYEPITYILVYPPVSVTLSLLEVRGVQVWLKAAIPVRLQAFTI